jgi:ketosteroid isomerase-like protein
MEKAMAMLIALAALIVSGQTDNARDVQAEIRRLNAQEVDALLHNDIKALSGLWSRDFVVTNPLNKFVNKQEVISLIESNILAFTSYDRQVEYVRIYGDTAIVAGVETLVWAGRMPNAGKTTQLRFTAVWMREHGRWQQVARHANILDQK